MLPSAGSTEHFLAYLSKFPPTDRPEVVGIHYNAGFAVIEDQGKYVMNNVYDFQYNLGGKRGQ